MASNLVEKKRKRTHQSKANKKKQQVEQGKPKQVEEEAAEIADQGEEIVAEQQEQEQIDDSNDKETSESPSTNENETTLEEGIVNQVEIKEQFVLIVYIFRRQSHQFRLWKSWHQWQDQEWHQGYGLHKDDWSASSYYSSIDGWPWCVGCCKDWFRQDFGHVDSCYWNVVQAQVQAKKW